MNDLELQNKARKLVEREVYANVSALISELAQDEKYIDKLAPVLSKTVWECSGCGYTSSDEDDLDECCDQAQAFETDKDEQTLEAFEHYIVSRWLANRLEEQGEMIIQDFMGLTIWGRSTTGQAIYLDGCIQNLVK